MQIGDRTSHVSVDLDFLCHVPPGDNVLREASMPTLMMSTSQPLIPHFAYVMT